jgi:hypothetical protein
MPGKAGGNPNGNKYRHDAHAEIVRQHQVGAMVERELQPGARESPGGVGGEGRENKYQHKRTDNHKRQRKDEAVTNGGNVFLLADGTGQRRDFCSITAINFEYRELMACPLFFIVN